MTAFEDFENTLKEVVCGKRLSASKMNKLTEIAMKSLEHDTKLVAILYRTHNSLPGSAKVSSLYAFDALARAAKSVVNKRGITGDVNWAKGNAATFLLKIEGVLDGLFRDMVSLDNPEAKEKTTKVLDIWVKSNTFSSAVLTRLRDILSDVRKENAVNPTPPAPTTEDTLNTTSEAQACPPPVSDVQATLLALLGQAAQGGQPVGQTKQNKEQMQQSQMLILQQVLVAKLANGSPIPAPGQTPPPPTDLNPPPAIPPPESSYSSSRPVPPTGRFDDARSARNDYPDRARDQRGFRDDRPSRGGARGGYRGRGRWDDHHRHRDRDWNPSSRPRRSRSRSPRRHEERRHVRTYSPPRRPLNDRDQPELPSTPPASTHGKDEFGRDIRASSGSPSRPTSGQDTQALAPTDSSVDPTAGVPPDNRIPVSDQMPLVAASTSAESTEARAPSAAPQQQQPGLDQFDIGTFDATAPSSWEGLGSMWRTTHGYPPSQEELMRYVMAESMAAAGMANGGFNGAQGGQWQQGNWEEQGPQNNGARQGGGNYGNVLRGGHRDESEPSYAVVLNGEDDKSSEPHGRMQRVGDKWVFVREGGEA